jgi:TetR/AcrR family transcriptional regulator, cholesterol catabolism regulator
MGMKDEHATPRIGSRGTDHDGETHDLILKAAQTMFLERGYKGVSMRDIADAVHVSQAALYYHFPQGKEQILYSMMEGMMAQWEAQLRAIVAHGDSLRSKLEGVARNFIGLPFGLPFDHMMVLMRDIHTNLPETAEREKMLRQMGVTLRMSTTLFQEAIDAGEIRTDLSAEYLAQLFGYMLGGIVRYAAMMKQDAAEQEKQAADLVSVLLDGISKIAT